MISRTAFRKLGQTIAPLFRQGEGIGLRVGCPYVALMRLHGAPVLSGRWAARSFVLAPRAER